MQKMKHIIGEMQSLNTRPTVATASIVVAITVKSTNR